MNTPTHQPDAGQGLGRTAPWWWGGWPAVRRGTGGPTDIGVRSSWQPGQTEATGFLLQVPHSTAGEPEPPEDQGQHRREFSVILCPHVEQGSRSSPAMDVGVFIGTMTA